MKHVIVYREPDRFAAWPANFGMWSWGDELVVGFTVGYRDVTRDGFHACDARKPFLPHQSRSLDGGNTWDAILTPAPSPGNRGFSADEMMEPELRATTALDDSNRPETHPGDVDFTHPDFALLCARTTLGAGAVSWFYTSTDRCHSWQGPYALPAFGMTGMAARTDYLVNGPQSALLFLTAAKARRTCLLCGDDGWGAKLRLRVARRHTAGTRL